MGIWRSRRRHETIREKAALEPGTSFLTRRNSAQRDSALSKHKRRFCEWQRTDKSAPRQLRKPIYMLRRLRPFEWFKASARGTAGLSPLRKTSPTTAGRRPAELSAEMITSREERSCFFPHPSDPSEAVKCDRFCRGIPSTARRSITLCVVSKTTGGDNETVPIVSWHL